MLMLYISKTTMLPHKNQDNSDSGRIIAGGTTSAADGLSSPLAEDAVDQKISASLASPQTTGIAPSKRSRKRILFIISGYFLALIIVLSGMTFVFRNNPTVSSVISKTQNAVSDATKTITGSSGLSGHKPGSVSGGNSNQSGQYADAPVNKDPAFLAQTASTLATGDPAPTASKFALAVKASDDTTINSLLTVGANKKIANTGKSLVQNCKAVGTSCFGIFTSYNIKLVGKVTASKAADGTPSKLVTYTVTNPIDKKTTTTLAINLIPNGSSWLVSDFKLGIK